MQRPEKRFHIKTKYCDCKGTMHVGYYSNGRKALNFIDEWQRPLFTATVNLPDVNLPENYVIIKNYSENEGVLEFLISEGIVKEPKGSLVCDYAILDVCELVDNETQEDCPPLHEAQEI